MALLHMMESALKKSGEPVYLNPKPQTFLHAIAKLHAFLDEGRLKQKFSGLSDPAIVTSMPISGNASEGPGLAAGRFVLCAPG